MLERFTTRRAEVAGSAFETLVSRHGPMVLRVCRGVLRDPHDVDDAFQATFLVLVKKARTIGERDLLGPWLYGVAHRVALKARGVAAKRNRREGGVIDDPPGEAAEGPWLDLRPILHEELNRLPEKYRKPVVLCHLQGLTHSEAAVELAWPVGTVSVRLTRARKLLKERLTRRGLSATAQIWTTGLSLEGASAVVPPSLISSTTKAALQVSTGKLIAVGALSSGALELTKRTLTSMMISRMKWLMIPLMLGLGVAGGVAGTRMMMPQGEKVDQTKRIAREPAREVFNKSTENLETVPPGYFDIESLATKGKAGPAPVRIGQILDIEVLEALPGRPITGERLVRPDGTITLGFYGDLQVAGLNRNQIKVKMLEQMRKYLRDEILGLVGNNPDGSVKPIPPVESNRIFVDDVVKYPDVAQVAQEQTKELESRIVEIEGKLDRVLKELEQDRKDRRPSEPPATKPTAGSEPE